MRILKKMKPCLGCGTPTAQTRCVSCQRAYGGARPSRPHQRELSTAWWRRISLLVRRMEPLCRRCKARGVTRLATETDHIVPRDAGGSHEMANLQPLCHDCHSAKTLSEARILQRPSGQASGETQSSTAARPRPLTGNPNRKASPYGRVHGMEPGEAAAPKLLID